MSRLKPKCQTLLPWLQNQLGKRCLAPLTHTDARALAAAVMTLEAYTFDRNTRLLVAFSVLVCQMQPSTQHLAYHAIAHCMEWSDRAVVWNKCDLPLPKNLTVCNHEPGGPLRNLDPAPCSPALEPRMADPCGICLQRFGRHKEGTHECPKPGAGPSEWLTTTFTRSHA